MGTAKDLSAAAKAYEAWVDGTTPTTPDARADKHRRMAADPFAFLRATYFRWVALVDALPAPPGPLATCVGDLHVENFGTWRDGEARLAWGVNDVDEADTLPAAFDLLRLVTSAELAREVAPVALPGGGNAAVVDVVLAGYADGLAAGGRCGVLDAPEPPVVERLLPQSHAQRWWQRLAALPVVEDPPPRAGTLLRQAFPRKAGPVEVRRRVAGMGSRDHVRLVGVADVAGAPSVREVKALGEPATWWVRGRPAGARIGAAGTLLLSAGHRSPDPSLRIRGRWVVRRLAPWSDRIELADLRARADVAALLKAMGEQAATLHLATAAADDLAALTTPAGRRWLTTSSARMVERTLAEAAAWRGLMRRKG